MTTSTVGVTVVSARRSRLRARVRACGTLYRYETHQETEDGLALLVACLCPHGHGVSGLPWRGWVNIYEGAFDLTDLTDLAAPSPSVTPAVVPLALTDGPQATPQTAA